MTVSETTALLTFRPRIKSKENDEINTAPQNITVNRAVLFMAVLFGCAGIVSFTIRYSQVQTDQPQQQLSYSSPLILVESELLQWDDWKDNANRAQSWFEGAVQEIPNITEGVQSHVQSGTSQISNWWDGTANSREEYTKNVAENAERFGNRVKTWWGDVATSSERVVSDADIGDKVTIIDNNFQRWWNKANQAERQWWNATVHQLKIDEENGDDWLKQNGGKVAERGSEFINLTKSKLSKEKDVVTEKGSRWLNASENELGKDAINLKTLGKDWVDSTKQAADSEVRATGKLADKWLKSSEDVLLSNRDKGLELGHKWLNNTEEAVKSEEIAALKEESGLWNATIDALHGDEAAISERAKTLLNSGKSALKSELTVVGDGEKLLWNSTEEALLHERDAAEQKFAEWWATTKSVARGKLTHITDTEENWWNATELWLRRHVQPANLGGNGAKQQKTLLYLNNSFAYSLLMNGYHWYDYSNDFFLLQGGLDVQINQAYCSVASAAAVMNSFRPFQTVPIDPVYSPHQYATQESLVNECVKKTVILRNDTFDGILAAPGGLSLEQLQKLLLCYDFRVTAHYVDPANVTIEDVRQSMEEALINPRKRVIVNFDRHSLGQDGGGHFSPIGSYSKKEDSFLIMDVAKYKYPPVWVPTERLYISLATEDGCGNWQYPGGQDVFQHLDRPTSLREYEKIMRHLKCRKMHRGFLIIQLPS